MPHDAGGGVLRIANLSFQLKEENMNAANRDQYQDNGLDERVPDPFQPLFTGPDAIFSGRLKTSRGGFLIS